MKTCLSGRNLFAHAIVSSMKTLTPYGVQDFAPHQAATHQSVVTTLADQFSQSGYERIITPTLEYYDTLEKGMEDWLKESAIKLFDSQGNLLVMRPDHTVPVARMMASHFQGQPDIKKVFYEGKVFRQTATHSHQQTEVFQSGLEYFGESGIAADVAVIETTLNVLKALGITEFCIDIGHVDFVNSLDSIQKEALIAGDYVTFGSIPKRAPLMTSQDHPYLQSLSEKLSHHNQAPHLHVNHGLVKGIHYYTGLILECHVPGCSQPIATGGRYDGLTQLFGTDCPAVGIAFNCSAITQLMMDRGDKS